MCLRSSSAPQDQPPWGPTCDVALMFIEAIRLCFELTFEVRRKPCLLCFMTQNISNIAIFSWYWDVATLFTLAYETVQLCWCARVEAMMLHARNVKSFYQEQKLRRNNKVHYLWRVLKLDTLLQQQLCDDEYIRNAAVWLLHSWRWSRVI